MPVEINADLAVARLADLEEKVQKRVLNKALRAGGQVLADALNQAAPAQVTFAGGNALLPHTLDKSFRARVRTGPNGKPQAVIGAGRNNYVVRWLEFGHRLVRGGKYEVGRGMRKSRGGGIVAGSVQPYPFVRNVFDERAKEAARAFKETFLDELGKRG